MADHPVSTAAAVQMSKICDHMVIRIDVKEGLLENGRGGRFHYALFRDAPEIFDCATDIYSADGYHGFDGREEMLQRVEKIAPDVVLILDADEMLYTIDSFWVDLEKFWTGQYDVMIQEILMASSDGRRVPQCPISRHCACFRWYPGISFGTNPVDRNLYVGGGGFNIPVYPITERPNLLRYIAKTKIWHFCFYTKEIENLKLDYYRKHKTAATVKEMMKAAELPDSAFDEWCSLYGKYPVFNDLPHELTRTL